MKTLFVLICIIGIGSANSNTISSVNTLPQEYAQLQLLILKGINDIRDSNNVTQLVWNDVLSQAAYDQAKYIAKTGELGHNQNVVGKEKLRSRLEYFGLKMQGMAENAAFVLVQQNTKFKTANGIDSVVVDTYPKLCKGLITTWMYSAPHKSNIVHPKFKETGLGFAYDSTSHKMFAVQVFAYPYQ